jgi:hypothetical protein
MRFGLSAKVMFQVSEWPWELIICFLGVLKKVFGENEEATFKGVERPYEHIFFILSTEKSVFRDVAWVMF